jgi:hypothetical protein
MQLAQALDPSRLLLQATGAFGWVADLGEGAIPLG